MAAVLTILTGLRLRVAASVLPVLLAVTAACAGGGVAGGASDVVTQVPFVPGERLVYALHDQTGAVIARAELSVRRDGERLVLAQSYEEASVPAGATPTADDISLDVDAVTLKPAAGSRTITRRASDGEASTEQYSWDYVPGDDRETLVTVRRRDGETERRQLRLREHHYDNEASLWLWRTLGLTDGYEARYVSVNHLERSQQTVFLLVDQRETISVPAGEFDVWRLQVRNGRAARVAWINAEPPHQVVQWDNGSVIFRLIEVGEVAD